MALDLAGIATSLVTLVDDGLGGTLKGFAAGLQPAVQTPPCFVVGPPAAAPAEMGLGQSWDYFVAIGVRVTNTERDPSYAALMSLTADVVTVLDGASEAWGSVRIDRVDPISEEGTYLEQLIQLTIQGA